MFNALIENLSRLRKLLTCLSIWKPQNLFMEVYDNLLIKKIPRQIPTLLVLAGIREDNPPHLRLTTVEVRVLASAENDM